MQIRTRRSDNDVYFGGLRLKKYLLQELVRMFREQFSLNNILADVVVTNAKQSNDSSPGCNDLAGQLAAGILPVCAKSNDATNNGKTDRVAQHDWVVSVLLHLLLRSILLCSSSVLDVLGFFLDFLFALDALGLSVGLDFLRLVVGGDG